jgi:eukaryotic-like serine/threonine-protein kinase
VNRDDWQKVWRVYSGASAKPPEERRAFVESSLPEGPLRDKAVELLEDHEDEDAPPAAEPAPDWRHLGKSLGRFHILSPVGRGGMGEVYRAFDSELDREVAIKCIAPANFGSSHAVAGFLREARAASALNHPGIVTVYEVIRTGETVAIVMELVEGEPFRSFTGKPHPARKVAHWGRQIAEALAASHARGIVHRDIKPENLILRRDGYTKILDFGLAADRSVAADSLPMGTVRYMSPEQGRAAALTPATDVFSLGIVLFELVTGVHPFAPGPSSDTTSVVHAIAGSEPELGPRRAARIPDALGELLREMLAKQPEARPGAASVAARLAEIAGEASGGRSMRKWYVLGAAAVLAIGAAGWLSRQSPGLEPVRLQISPFTTYQGIESQPAFSPDGSRIAYVWTGESGQNRDIYLQGLNEAQPVRLTSDPAEDVLPVFSPDGSRIAFLRQVAGSSTQEVRIVPAGGGEPELVGPIAPSFGFVGLAWWPDGKSLVVRDGNSGRAGLHRLTLADGARRQITFPPEGRGDGHPAFSPDGKWLAFIRYSAAAAEVCVTPAANPSAETLRCLAESPMNDIAWLPDSERILYAGNDAIWSVNVGGKPRPERFAEGNFAGLTLHPNGQTFAFTRSSAADSNVWRMSSDGKRSTRLVASSREDSSPSWSSDGRFVVRSNRSGNFELYTYAADGSGQKRITDFGAHIDNPRWSPDNAWIVFDGNRASVDPNVKHHNIFVVPAGGGPHRRITDDSTHYSDPSWSHDGQWIYYLKEGTPDETWKVPAAGGDPVRIMPQQSQDLAESADGEYLYYVSYDGASGIRRRRAADGQEEALPGTEGVQIYRYWSLARQGIFFIPGPTDASLRYFDLRTRRVSRITAVSPNLVKGPRGLAVSPDGSTILCTIQDMASSDIMLARVR